MTYHALVLEDFNNARPDTPHLAEADAEAIRLDGFETGYKSGWDDANAESAASDRRIAADLERSLSDLSFTYEEARAEVLQGMSGLISSILSGFLPRLAAAAILPRVTAEIDALIASIGTGTCRLLAAPGTCKQLEWLAEKYIDMDLQVEPEAAYPDGRVTLHFASETREIDLSQLEDAMAEAIRDFTVSPLAMKEARHG